MKCFYCGWWKGSVCGNEKSEFHGKKTGISGECEQGMKKEDIEKLSESKVQKELKMEKKETKKAPKKAAAKKDEKEEAVDADDIPF